MCTLSCRSSIINSTCGLLNCLVHPHFFFKGKGVSIAFLFISSVWILQVSLSYLPWNVDLEPSPQGALKLNVLDLKLFSIQILVECVMSGLLSIITVGLHMVIYRIRYVLTLDFCNKSVRIPLEPMNCNIGINVFLTNNPIEND